MTFFSDIFVVGHMIRELLLFAMLNTFVYVLLGIYFITKCIKVTPY